MRNPLESSSAQLSVEELSVSKGEVLPLLKAKNHTYNSSEFTQIISAVLARTHLRKVLKNNSGRTEGHFNIILFCFPVQDVHSICFFHQEAITVTDTGFKQHSYGIRQSI